MISVADYAREARRALPRMLGDFVDGGSLSETTLRRNRDGFGAWWLRSRSFSASAECDLSTKIFGTDLRVPIMIAPTGASGMLWPKGEAEVALAASQFGIAMSVSAGSILDMEEIASAAPGVKWLQIFLYKDRGLTAEFVRRAKEAGYQAICVTTDAPVHGIRERDIRNGFTIDRCISARTAVDALLHLGWWMRMARAPKLELGNFRERSTGGMTDMASYIASVLDPDVTWDDLSWLRAQWDGPLVVKGILHPQDARECIERGADGIQVSNHGGRQLDCTLATIDALPAIVTAVDNRVPIFIDGGITRGTDVIKALALGASACLIGRAHLWGLAVDGRNGVLRILEILEAEMRSAMTIGGWKSLADLGRASVVRLDQLNS